MRRFRAVRGTVRDRLLGLLETNSPVSLTLSSAPRLRLRSLVTGLDEALAALPPPRMSLNRFCGAHSVFPPQRRFVPTGLRFIGLNTGCMSTLGPSPAAKTAGLQDWGATRRGETNRV